MSAVIESDQVKLPDTGPVSTSPSKWRRARLPLALCVLVGIMAQLPLIGDRIFYYSDDSAAVFVPSWHYIGSQLLSGHWPVLAGDLWQGGNFAAEVQLSLWNPIMLVNDVMVALLPDVAVGATIVKTEFLILLALGVYLLCREYGARPWPAFVVGMLLPFAGFTFYFDAGGWAISMISFAWVPHVWWTARRCARGRLNPIVPVLVAFMATTSGSPYGTLGVAITLLVLIVERLVLHERKAAIRLLLISLSIAMAAVVVYVPLVLTGAVTFRTDKTAFNNGYMVTGLGDLLHLSSPTYLPHIATVQLDRLTVPYAYLGWFVLPLVPWFAFSTLRSKIKPHLSLLLFAAISVLLTTGPSNVWLFRWPMRLIDYVYLPVCVLIALLLSAGLRKDHVRQRIIWSAALIGLQAVLAFSAWPGDRPHHIIAMLVIGGLTAITLTMLLRKNKPVEPVLIIGSIVLFALQLLWYPYNGNMVPWNLPHNVSALHKQFQDRYLGNTFVVGDIAGDDPDMAPDKLWKDVLRGSAYSLAGVHALNAYTGIGFTKYDDMFCMFQGGGTCPGAYENLWLRDKDSGKTMADLLRLQTVVVLNKVMPGKGISSTGLPEGWVLQEKSDQVTVLRRVNPIPSPQGRISWSEPGVRIRDDQQLPNSGEDFSYTGSGKVVLAALDWPGMTATVDGNEIPVTRGTMGLVTLDLPQRSSDANVQVRFTPPGWDFGIPLLIGGLLLGLGHAVAYAQAQRKRGKTSELASN